MRSLLPIVSAITGMADKRARRVIRPSSRSRGARTEVAFLRERQKRRALLQWAW